MDNGKVTGSDGKEADARNCILILTTNLGARTGRKNAIDFNHDLEGEYGDEEFKRLDQSLEIGLTELLHLVN